MRIVRTALAAAALASGAACAATGATPAPFPRPGAAPAVVSGRLLDSPSALVDTAMSFRGVAYRNGGADPSGFDCSGLVAYVFARHGLYVPRTTDEQFTIGRRIGRDSVEPGDLVFFTTIAPGASHVGIAISGREFVHAPSSTGVVRVESLAAPYWSSRFVGARRIR